MARSPVRWAAAALVAALLAALALAASRHTLLLLDLPERRATLLVPRAGAYGMRWLETDASLCARQSAGSPLHSVHLPPQFCPMALATGIAAPGRALLELPYSPLLRRWAE